MIKHLVTHVNPHLDEIAAIWLLRKFHAGWADAEIAFVPSGNPGEITFQGELPDTNPEVLFLGVGGGKFDEHWGGKHDKTTADLIWEWLDSLKEVPTAETERRAIANILSFADKDDRGHLKNMDQEVVDFSLTNIISASNFLGDSQRTVRLSMEALDCLFPLFTKKQEALAAFEKRVDFESIWGKASAVEGELIPGDPFDSLTYRAGGVLMVLVDHKQGYRQFRAKSDSDVDLTEAFEVVKKLEPDVDWWLHPNKRLLVSGGNVTVGKDMPLSKLTQEALMKIVEKK